MAVYQVVDYFDVWGNPIDGFEVNNQRTAGTVMVRDTVDRRSPSQPDPYPDDRRIVVALVEKGDLGEQALEYFDSGILQVESPGDFIEISETVEAWQNTEEAGEEGGYVDQPVTMTAEEVAEAEDDGYTANAYELVANQKPLLALHPIDSDPDAKPFWRDLVETYGEHWGDKKRPPAVLELRANPENLERKTRTGRGVLRVESHVDGEYFGTFDFPDRFEDDTNIGITADGGIVALEEGGDVEIQALKVALDEFLERGGVASRDFLRAPEYRLHEIDNETWRGRVFLAQAHGPQNGYAYKLDLNNVRHGRPANWNEAHNDDWQHVLVSTDDFGEEVGVVVIDGVEMRVWAQDELP